MKTAQGRPPLGILMLDTKFERPLGDVGNVGSWPFPVVFETISGATSRMVIDGHFDRIVAAIRDAASRAEQRGAIGLTTSCGFLAAMQVRLSSSLPLPIATSSLLQITQISRCLPNGKRVGVVTYDADSLTGAHFHNVGAPADLPVAGLPRDGVFHAMIERGARYEAKPLAAEVLAACRALVDANPDIGALVFECTNLPPFSALVAAELGLPVYDILTMGCWFYAGLRPAALTAS